MRTFLSQYVKELREVVKDKNPSEPEFHQAVNEIAQSLSIVLERHPEYHTAKIRKANIPFCFNPIKSYTFQG